MGWQKFLPLIGLFTISTGFAAEGITQLKAVEQQLEYEELLEKEQPPIEQKQKKKEEKLPAKGGVRVLVKKIVVEGNTLLPPEELQKVLSKYEGKELSFRDMIMLVREITDLYHSHGYLTAYAYLPPQKIKNGVLKVAVVEGKVEKIEVEGNKRYSENFFKAHFEDLLNKPFNLEAFKRGIINLSDYPFLKAAATLKRGQTLGSSILVVKVKEEKPYKLFLKYDNYGSKVMEKNRLLLNFAFEPRLREGDLFEVKYLVGLDQFIDPSELYMLKADYKVPVNYKSGLKAGAYTVWSGYDADGPYSEVELKGKTRIYALYFEYPIINEADLRVKLIPSFVYKDVYEYLLGSRFYKDALRIARLEVFFSGTDPLKGYNKGKVILDKGIVGIFGGTGYSDTAVSRKDGDPGFFKVTLIWMRNQKLVKNFYLFNAFSGQWTDDRLFAPETFTIGGFGTVRGFDPGTYSGDKGFAFTTELSYRTAKYPFGFEPFAFFDWGGVFVNDAQEGEKKNAYLTSLGVGLKVAYKDRLNLRVDYAKPLVDDKFGDYPLYLSATLKF
jgi:hemolysin activation/secretion protein